MTQTTSLTQTRSAPARHDVAIGFGSLESFELMQRAAKLLSSSTLVPVAYRAVIEKTDRYGNVTDSRQNPNALANSVVALNMAQRMGADPLAVMQNLYIVEGRPSWSSQWIIAAINSCGRFSPLRFHLKSLGKRRVDYTTFVWENKQRQEVTKTAEIEDKECIAWAVENGTTIPQFDLVDLKEYGGVYGCCKEYGIPLVESPLVSISMAVKEGWYTKNGSKWQTMPDVMLRYRTASFFGKLYAPELLMGLQTTEEVQDTLEATTAADGSIQVDVESLRASSTGRTQQKQARTEATDVELKAQQVDPDTGEVTSTSREQAQAEAGTPAPEAESSAPASDEGYVEHGKVRHALRQAQDHDTLDVAADLIQDADPKHHDALRAYYRQRQDELDGVNHVPEQTKPQPTARARRQAANLE